MDLTRWSKDSLMNKKICHKGCPSFSGSPPRLGWPLLDVAIWVDLVVTIRCAINRFDLKLASSLSRLGLKD